MGIVSSSAISVEELEEYAELLYLSRSEILHLYKRAKDLGPELDQDRQCRFDVSQLGVVFPELRWNPFADRLVRIFSSENDGKLSFEDLLDLYSAFNEKCPDALKATWAFKIFDFDDDNVINRDDIVEMITRLTSQSQANRSSQNAVEQAVMGEIADRILSDLDLDKTGAINATEFRHALIKIPDFWNSFQLKDCRRKAIASYNHPPKAIVSKLDPSLFATAREMTFVDKAALKEAKLFYNAVQNHRQWYLDEKGAAPRMRYFRNKF